MSFISNEGSARKPVENLLNKIPPNAVTLRTLTAADLDRFYLWASDPEVAKTMTWGHYTSKDAAERFLREVVETHPWFKAICLDGVPVGSITLAKGLGASSCRAELGLVLVRQVWGRGIATEAIKRTLEIGFSDLNVARIEAFVDPANIASSKALLKSGMECEGLLRSYLMFKGQLRNRYLFAKVSS